MEEQTEDSVVGHTTNHFSIYKIENKVNGKIYVGLTKGSVENRFKEHVKNRYNRHIGNAIQKYGIECFVVSIVDHAGTKKEASEKEIDWIKKLNCRSPNGYNLTGGGDGLCDPSPETIEKLRLASSQRNHTQEEKDKIGEGNARRIWKDESRKKLSETVTGRKYSDETNKKKGRKGNVPWNTGVTKETNPEASLKLSSGRKGKPAWNKGLTKTTDERVAKNIEAMSATRYGKKEE